MNKRVINTGLIFLFVFLCFSGKICNALSSESAAQTKDTLKNDYIYDNRKISLTGDEEAWLKSHRTIRFGSSLIVPPFMFSEDDRLKGVFVDYLNLMSERTGIQFKIILNSPPEFGTRLKAGEIDMFPTADIPERKAFADFTLPLMNFDFIILTRNDMPFISGLSSLKGKKMASIKGLLIHNRILNNFPDIIPYPVANFDEAMNAVLKSKAEVFIADIIMTGYLQKDYPNIKIAGTADIPPEPQMYAVRKDFPQLTGILNKAIRSISKEEHKAIRQKWFRVQVEYKPNLGEFLKLAGWITGFFIVILGITLLWNRRLAKEIADRKLAEEALRDSEEQYRDLVQNANNVIFRATPNWEITFFNRYAQEFFGYTEDEILGKRVFNTIVPDSESLSGRDLTVLLHDIAEYPDKYRYNENENIRKNGERVWLAWTNKVIFDSEGNPEEILCIANDITEKKKAEEALQRSNSLLKAQQESMIDGIVTVDENKRLTGYNQRFINLWNLPDDIVRSRDERKMLKYMLSCLKSPDKFLEKVKYLYENIFKTGQDEIEMNDGRTFEWYCCPVISSENQYLGKIWFFRDISERRQAEKEIMEAKEAAESSSRAKSEFLANMGHEIRTPMNSVLGFMQLTLDYPDLPKAQRDNLNTAYNSAKSLMALLNNILDLSKLESGRLELEEKIFDPANIIQDAMKTFEIRVKEKGLKLSSNISPELSKYYSGDPMRLKQILINLMDNAVKFTEKGGIFVTVKKEKDNSILHFSISDTGVGIPKESLKKIFEPFTQADSSASRRFGGTGLGTSISRQLVELMGGEIYAESEEGKGSTFCFTVKMKPANQAAEKAALKADDDSVHLLAPEPEETLEFVKTSENSQSLQKLFYDLLNSFEEYNPDAAEPFLEKLGQYISAIQISPITQAVDRFDFDGAKEASLKLAEDLDIYL